MKHNIQNQLSMQKFSFAIKSLCVAILFCLSFSTVKASHFMGGEITYVCIGPNTYSVTMKMFRDCNSSFTQPDPTIDITSAGCGLNTTVSLSSLNGNTVSIITPLCNPAQDDICVNGGGFGSTGLYGIEQWLYRGIVQLPASATCTDIVFSWGSCCRNGIITTGPSNDGFYLEATLDNTLSDCNNSPAFNYDPTVFLCLGQENYFNHGVTDIDDDSLVFSLADCLDGANTTVNYNSPFSGTNPLSAAFPITIDPATGQLNMIPTTLEVGVLCVKVEEYRNGVKISEVLRDLQFSVIDCGTNTVPFVSGINGTADSTGFTGSFQRQACVGEDFCFDIDAFDLQGAIAFQDVSMEWSVGIAGATFIIDDSGILPKGTFCWTPEAKDVGKRFFTVRLEDDACPVYANSVFTYTIDVIPNNLTASIDTIDGGMFGIVNDSITLDTIGQSVQLQGIINTDTTGLTINWSPSDGLSCTDCLNPTFTSTIGGTTTYTFTITDPDNCSGSSEVVVTVPDLFPVSTTPLEALVNEVKVAPNPFSYDATLSYDLLKASDVTIEVFNLIGQRVGTLANERQVTGRHQYQLGQAVEQGKGVYFVRLKIDNKIITKKVIVQ